MVLLPEWKTEPKLQGSVLDFFVSLLSFHFYGKNYEVQIAQRQIAGCVRKVNSLQSGMYLHEMKSDYSPDSC